MNGENKTVAICICTLAIAFAICFLGYNYMLTYQASVAMEYGYEQRLAPGSLSTYIWVKSPTTAEK